MPRHGQARSPMRLLTIGSALAGTVLVGLLLFVNQAPAAADLRLPTSTAAAELASARTLGRADAPVTLTVWSDFQCPACGAFVRSVEPRLRSEYVAKGILRMEYRDIAFIGAESLDAAVGARCAADQSRFWPFHDYLFANQQGENLGTFSPARLRAIGTAVGLDMGAYDRCVAAPDGAIAVKSETAVAGGLGFHSTPTIVVGEHVFQGVPAWADLTAVIETAAGLRTEAPSASAAP